MILISFLHTLGKPDCKSLPASASDLCKKECALSGDMEMHISQPEIQGAGVLPSGLASAHGSLPHIPEGTEGQALASFPSPREEMDNH